MAEQLPDIEFKGIERINEFGDPELIKKTEVAAFDNMILDKVGGKATKRGAITVFNSNAAGGAIVALHDVVDSSGNNLLLASMGTKLIKSTDGTAAWADLKTGLTTGLRTKIVPYMDKFIVTNGTDVLFITDLTTVWNLEISAPVVTSVVSAEANGGDLNVDTYPYYRYVLVYVTNLGELSAPSQPFSHIFYDAIGYATTKPNTGYQTVRFDNLPTSADTRVVARLLFRTQAISNINTGSFYYLLATLDNTTTYFVDSFADTLLDISKTITFVTVPTKSKCLLAHKERIFFGNITLSDKLAVSPECTKINGSPSAGYRAGFEFTVTGSVGSGGLTAGTYKYRAALIDSAGHISDYVEETVILSGGQNQVEVLHPPNPPSASYTMNFYRTKVGGSIFYSLGVHFIFNDIGYTDGTADASLTVVMPTNSTINHKSGIMYSEIGQPASVNAYNIKQINPDDGDQITGLIDMGDRILIYKKNSICQMLTLGDPLNWQIEVIYTKKGNDDEYLIKKAGDKIYFISNKQVYRFPDYMDKPVSLNKLNTFKAVTTFTDMFYSNYYNWLFVLADGVMYIYDEKLDAWYEFYCDDQDWKIGLEKIHGSTRNTLLFSHLTAQIISKYNTSSSIDNDGTTSTEIMADITFKTLAINDEKYLGRLRFLEANYKKKDNQGISHQIYSPDDALQRYTTDSTNATKSSDYKSMIYVTDALTGTLKSTNKFWYRIYGAGLEEFNSAKIKYMIVRRGISA